MYCTMYFRLWTVLYKWLNNIFVHLFHFLNEPQFSIHKDDFANRNNGQALTTNFVNEKLYAIFSISPSFLHYVIRNFVFRCSPSVLLMKSSSILIKNSQQQHHEYTHSFTVTSCLYELNSCVWREKVNTLWVKG